MKKIIKLSACLLAVVCLIFSLTGCQELDEMRKAHGVWTKVGTTIMLNGNEYINLPYFGEHYTLGEWDTVYVTTSEVPVLLSDAFGKQFYISDDGVILENQGELQNSYYCRKDRYDEISKSLEKGIEYNGYCYLYTDYDKDFDEWEDKTYTLTKEQVDAVNYVRGNVEGVMLEGDDPYYYSDYSVVLERCGDIPYFVSEGFSLHFADGGYYLIETDDGYDYMYAVPDEINNMFKGIMSVAIAADDKFNDYMQDQEDLYYEEYPAI